MSQDVSEYGLSKQVRSARIPAPNLSYLPRLPGQYRPKLGLIGAGGVTEYHLRAYQKLGLEVAAICDVNLERARSRRDQFYPSAGIYDDYQQLLRRDDIEVVDAALHPEHRLAVMTAAITAGKHVLSQKPFVLDLDAGLRLAELADQAHLTLAVNQNGRWAPHFAYLLAAIRAGLVGEVGALDFNLAFDHSWTIGTPFEEIHHLLLYDFGVHWFDIASCVLGERKPKSIYASVARASYQKARPPFLASVVIDADGVQVRMAFNAVVKYGQIDRTLVAGSLGTIESAGPSLSQQQVVLTTEAGIASPDLTGTWFEHGFQGSMCELLCAIEENREADNSARNNLRTLELSFAALSSANTGLPVRPGTVRTIPS
jgi:predicted dehydrogenase